MNRPDANGNTVASKAVAAEDDDLLCELYHKGATGVAASLGALKRDGQLPPILTVAWIATTATVAELRRHIQVPSAELQLPSA